MGLLTCLSTGTPRGLGRYDHLDLLFRRLWNYGRLYREEHLFFSFFAISSDYEKSMTDTLDALLSVMIHDREVDNHHKQPSHYSKNCKRICRNYSLMEISPNPYMECFWYSSRSIRMLFENISNIFSPDLP